MWTRLRSAWGLSRPRAAILLYHRVAGPGEDPQLLRVRPQRFAEHLELLADQYHPLSLAELGSRLAGGKPLPPRSVVLTFDDGYADNLLEATPLLERSGVPATCFVVAGQVGTTREFWWDELGRILLGGHGLPPALELDMDGAARRWDLSEPGGQAAPVGWNVRVDPDGNPRCLAYKEVAAWLRLQVPSKRDEVLEGLRQWAGLGPEAREENLALSLDELARLDASGVMEVGAHTMNHPRLSSLDPEEQRREIMAGKQKLQELLDREVPLFSYPYGGRADYDQHSVALAQEAGFSLVCSNFPGTVRAGAGLFELPRFLVRDWRAEELAENLRLWFGQ